MGGEIGTAFVTTLARVREQVASNLIGQHVQVGDPDVIQRVRAYGAVTTRVIDPVGRRAARPDWCSSNVVRAAATTQAVMDAFVAIGFLTAVALLIVVFRSAAPEGPASPPPLFPRARVEAAMSAESVRARGSCAVLIAACRRGLPRRAELSRARAAERAPRRRWFRSNATAETTAAPPDAWWRLYEDSAAR